MPRRTPAADARRYVQLGKEIDRLSKLRADAIKARRGIGDLDTLIREARTERLRIENRNLGKAA